MYNQEYLENLIKNRVEENLNLDYKACGSLERNDKKTNEISKDVSAFANSDGGVIIYGIKEDSQNKHLPGEIDPIDRDRITKEWLEQIIQSKIRPRIDNFLIHPIEIDNSLKNVVYLVEIHKSITAHQADDKKYYRRYNFNSVPMHDYEIRDILNRIKTPIINLEFEIVKTQVEIEEIEIKTNAKYRQAFHIRVYARNVGKILAQYINCFLSVPKTLIDRESRLNCSKRKEEYIANNTIREVVDVQMIGMSAIKKYGPSRYDPILPRMKMKMDFDIPELYHGFYDDESELSWTVYADNAEPQKGIIKIEDIKMISE